MGASHGSIRCARRRVSCTSGLELPVACAGSAKRRVVDACPIAGRARRRICVKGMVSGEALCEVEDVEATWDAARLKAEIEARIGVCSGHQHLVIRDYELQDDAVLGDTPGLWPDELATEAAVSMLRVDWTLALSGAYPEIRDVANGLGASPRRGHAVRLLGDAWSRCSDCQQLESVRGTPDYVVAFKLVISESWRRTRNWGQVVLFTGNGFPGDVVYPCRAPNFVLDCDGKPRLLIIVSNHSEWNQHLDTHMFLSCTDYELPTEQEISIVLAVFGEVATVSIDGHEVRRADVGDRDSHERLEVHPNPPDVGWISMHGYEVPNEHAQIRELFHVSFP